MNGPLVHLLKGPIKELMSATRKFEQIHAQHAEGHWEKPDARYVCDMTRLSLSAADPMVLGILYAAIHDMPGVQIMFTNNKYLGTLEDVKKSGSPSVLVNMQVEAPGLPPFISEVQLYLDPFLSLKKSQHKTYEITRAKKLSDLLKPIYKPDWEGRLSSGLSNVIDDTFAI